ncbi:Wall-associated receptor kinase, galacturonan-binding domain [Sesbania bispinosa]|nr:Wall-associated receptor kinase, galacturonan-binding domain [Sesbania bispinosa]
MFLHQQTNFATVITILIFLVSTTRTQNLPNCENRCGEESVQYPFSFSEGCGIKLNCNNSKVQVGDFLVQNITSSSIFIDLPAKCNRTMESIHPLFSDNFAPTRNNSFLVQDCKASLGGCVIPASSFVGNCDNRSGNISCFTQQQQQEQEVDVVSYEELNQTGCNYLFSAVAAIENSLQFQVVELGWWLQGSCQCSPNATCTMVHLKEGSFGYRCQCPNGFQGDGFANGTGCRRGPSCSASTLTSGGCGNGAKIGVIVGVIVTGAVVVVALFVLCYCARRRSTWLRKHTRVKLLLREAAGNSSVPLYPYKEIEKATNSFSEKQRLGNGAFGTVYAGKLHNDEWVAIKKIRYRDTNSVDQVMNEIKLLSSVSHPNLVRLLGCCIEEGEQILVYEYMPNGTLSEHLQREREIITAMKVVDFGRPQSEVNLAALAVDRIRRGSVDEIIDPFLEPHRDAWTLYSIHKVAELAFRCLAFHSDMRPTMTEVAEELEHIRRSGWATMEETICLASSIGSTSSSPRNGSEKSLGGGIKFKKPGQGSEGLIVPQKTESFLHPMEMEVKDSSPVSVHDPWSSGHSSPSTNSLLGNVVR